ncbi:SCP domain-containing protein [Fusarium sp. LHS14.1]|nr:SCP domain-containing protein [Fusarium sp. LHS14.1]
MYFSKLAISMLAATGAVAHPHARRAAQNDVVVVEYVTKVVTEYGTSQPTAAPQRHAKQHNWWTWKPSQPAQVEQPAQTTVVVEAPKATSVAPAASAPAASSGSSGSSSGNLDADQQGALDAHNAARAAVGNPDLVWDDELAAGALEYAKQLVSIGSLVHSGADGFGENLYQGGEGEETPLTNAVNMFNDEKKDYSGQAIDSSNYMTFGHYTQVVWKSTTKVGMAKAEGNGKCFVVARYQEPGNMIGEAAY